MMPVTSIISILLLLPTGVDGLKILAYNPVFGHHHSNFIGTVADVLSEAGHEVVILTPIIDTSLQNRTSKHARVIFVEKSDEFGDLQDEDYMTNLWESASVGSLTKTMKSMSMRFTKQCEKTITTPGLMEQLRAEKFDVAYTEAYCQCGYMIFYQLGIQVFAHTAAINAHDCDFHFNGRPTIPSYVPGALSRHGEHMSFLQRVENTVTVAATAYFRGIFVEDFNALSQKLFPGMPRPVDIFANVSYAFYNTEPLIDFPKVTTAKIVPIGGVTVQKGSKPLNEYWTNIMSLRKHTVLVSFGSVTRAYLMPQKFKEGLREAFRQMPDVTFIFKYEVLEHKIGEGLDNVIVADWIPQNDILRSGRLSTFVTHGGIGSITESVFAGVPMVVVPVMGDQFRNGRMVERLGSGVYVDKNDLAHPDVIVKAFTKILGDESFLKQSLFYSSMISNQPVSARQRLVSHFEFMAKYGPLRQLDHASRDMHWFKFYSLDVILFVSTIVLLVAVITVYCILKVVKLIMRTFTVKQKKH